MICSNKWNVIICMTLGLIISQGGLTSIAHGKTTDQIIENRTFSEISQVRKMLRTACAKIKKADAKPEDADNLLHGAEVETRRALEQWQTFYQGYPAVAPSGYAKHPSWYSAAKEIKESIRKMAQSEKDKDAKTALASCGQTCQKFVKMNEMAGIELTADILFQFRKAAKPLLTTIQESDSIETTPAVQTLLSLKNQAMDHAVDDTDSSVSKKNALSRFAKSADAFAVSADMDNRVAIIAQYQEMMSLLEVAYDFYL